VQPIEPLDLRHRIASGEWQADQALPTVAALAGRSRLPYQPADGPGHQPAPQL